MTEAQYEALKPGDLIDLTRSPIGETYPLIVEAIGPEHLLVSIESQLHPLGRWEVLELFQAAS